MSIAGVLARQRRERNEQEGEATARLIAVHDEIVESIEGDLEAVTDRIAEAQAAGETVNPDWLRRQARYEEMLASVERQYGAFEFLAAPIVADATTEAAQQGAQHGWQRGQELGVASSSFRGNVNVPAIDALLGRARPGSPLSGVLRAYGPRAAAIIERELITGMARGLGPRTILREMQRQLTGPVTRSRLLALIRTESMGAYRTAQSASFAGLGPAVTGKRWNAARSARTCLACLARDGTVYPLDYEMDSHVSCRCSWSPAVSDMYPGAQRALDALGTGEDWFNRQPADVQRRMIGNPQAFAAYQRGDITLQDFVGTQSHPVWGDAIFQKSGTRVLREAGAGGSRASRSWYDSEGNWNPPSPGPNTWRAGMPEEGDAAQHFGTEWVADHLRVPVPGDLTHHIGTTDAVFDVDMHALNQVVPGFKHENAQPYVDNLEDVLAHATHWNVSGKQVGTERRLEVYRTFPDGQAVIVILGHDPEATRSSVVSAYVLRPTTVENRLANGRMKRRE